MPTGCRPRTGYCTAVAGPLGYRLDAEVVGEQVTGRAGEAAPSPDARIGLSPVAGPARCAGTTLSPFAP